MSLRRLWLLALPALAQPAPLPRGYFKHLSDALLRGTITFAPHCAAVLVFNLVPALFQLAHRHVNAFENVERLVSLVKNRPA